jgi:hypothetical protein
MQLTPFSFLSGLGWFLMDKIVCTNIYIIPDTSWYKPVEIKNSPRQYDLSRQKRKKIVWLPKRLRKHPKMQKLFGKQKEKRKQRKTKSSIPRKTKSKGEYFNRIVEEAYKSGKI